MTSQFQHLIPEAIQVLRDGGVILHPTETCYGLAADIFHPEAVEKIYILKEMPREKPVSIMVSSLEQASEYGDFGDDDSPARRLSRALWPGPLTIIVKRGLQLPSYMNPGLSSVGLRCPDDGFTLELLRQFCGPLVTTSANRTGQPQAYDVETFLEDRIEVMHPDFVVDLGRIALTPPSTIVDVSGESGVPMVIVRHGPVSAEEVKRVFEGR